MATVTWSVAILWLAVALAGCTALLWSAWLPGSPGHRGLASLLGYDGLAAEVAVNTALGFIFLLTLPPVVHALGRAQTELGRSLIGRVRPG